MSLADAVAPSSDDASVGPSSNVTSYTEGKSSDPPPPSAPASKSSLPSSSSSPSASNFTSKSLPPPPSASYSSHILLPIHDHTSCRC